SDRAAPEPPSCPAPSREKPRQPAGRHREPDSNPISRVSSKILLLASFVRFAHRILSKSGRLRKPATFSSRHATLTAPAATQGSKEATMAARSTLRGLVRGSGIWGLAMLGIASAADRTGSAAASAQAFEKFRSLEGTWRGESTRGWSEDVSFKSIAGGS